jgi:hypothetical protein
MKFRFCGDLDCPNWVLSEVAELSKLTSVRVKVIANQVVINSLEGTFNHEKVLKLTTSDADGLSTIKGVIAAVHFILINAARYDIDEASLTQEIQQLGLPKENAEAITKIYRDQKVALRGGLSSKSFRVSRLVDADWRVDHIIASSDSPAGGGAGGGGSLVHLSVKSDPNPHGEESQQNTRAENTAFEMSVDQLDLLLHELVQAREKMKSLSNE